MNEAAIAVSESVNSPSVASDVNDAEFEAFFSSGGKKLPQSFQAETPETKEVKEVKESKEVKEDKEVEVKEKEPPEKIQANLNAALREERAKFKKAQSDWEAKHAKLEQRFQQIVENLNPKQPPPSLEDDPVAHFAHKTKELEEQINREKAEREQLLARTQQEKQIQDFDNAYRTHATKFSQETPDFNNAYEHLISLREKVYRDAGIDDAEIPQRIASDERMVAYTAFQLGINPAQLLYNLALSNGYSKKEASQIANKQIEKMNTLEKGTQTKTLSNVGSSAKENLTLEALAEMDDDDFTKNWNKLIKQR